MADTSLVIVNSKKSAIDITGCVVDAPTYSTEREGTPGKFTFECYRTKNFKIERGASVRYIYKGIKVFKGFVFETKDNEQGKVSVTCYDQLRYFKNKDTYIYKNKTADEVIKMIIKDYKLKAGSIAKCKHKIPKALEDNKTLFDIVKNALHAEEDNKRRLYVLYDSYGKLNLKDVSKLTIKPNVWAITSDMVKQYDLARSIDSSTYNQIKLYSDVESKDKKKKTRKVYIAKDSKNIGKWGLLQYAEKLEDGENGKAKANALLKYYNTQTRTLSLKGVKGRPRVRAGYRVWVQIKHKTLNVNSYFIVEKCTHRYEADNHTMDLTLIGGDINSV